MGSYSRKRYATESVSFPKSANSAPASYSYATFADLPTSGSTPGNTAFVVATNRLYIWSGVGWYLIATVTNASPTAITGVSDTYALAADGTATTITAVSTDPEGFTLSWSYAVSSGSLNGTTVSQADNVFTITPHASNPTTFSITFNVTDGLNGSVSKVSAFTLSFFIANSRYTSLSVKATATGSNQTFDDASASNHTITVAGDTTASTFSPYRHGGYSLDFDGTGDYLDVGSSGIANFGTGNFTIEFWINSTDANALGSSASNIINPISSTGSGYWGLLFQNGKLRWNNSYNVANLWEVNASTILEGSFNHIAVVRNSGAFSIYFNGVSQSAASGTFTDTTNYSGDTGVRIGSGNANDFVGTLSDLRIVSSAVYTTNFTPPTASLTAITNTKILLGNLHYFKDQSASNHAITVGGNVSLAPKSLFDNAPYSETSHGASVYFDGSGDYLTFSESSDFNVGTGDFTIEVSFYYSSTPPTGSGYDYIWGFGPSTTAGLGLYVQGGIAKIYNGSAVVVSTTAVKAFEWTTIAIVRSGTTLSLYKNGTREATATVSSDITGTGNNFSIGRWNGVAGGHEDFYGYVTDFRFINGTAVRTGSSYTLPTAPLTTSPTYPAMAIGVANSGASAYTLSGDVTGNNATVNMAVGQTVNFTVNASGHPFYIRVSDGGANVSTPAATGQGATSGVVSWTPNTAGTYYYQCGNHASMIGTINVTDGVKLLLNPETSISDLSQSSAIKCVGDAATDTTQVKFAGTKSIAFDGTGDYLTFDINGDIGANEDFTVELWHRFSSDQWGGLFQVAPQILGNAHGTNIPTFAISRRTSGGRYQMYSGSGGSSYISAGAGQTTVGQWYHLAYVRYNGTIKIYEDGTEITALSAADTTVYTNPKGVIGGKYATGYLMYGNIQDFRFTRGLARYTANFTPPTAELEG